MQGIATDSLMISSGQYLRLSLLLPLLLPVLVIVILLGILHLVITTDDPVMRPAGVGETLRELAVDGTRSGVWPAYALWCLGFLLWTARFPADRLRRAMWFAPLSFAPLAGIAWVVAQPLVGRARDLQDMIIGGGAYLVAGLVGGYLVVLLVYAFEQLGFATKLVRRSPPTAIPSGV